MNVRDQGRRRAQRRRAHPPSDRSGFPVRLLTSFRPLTSFVSPVIARRLPRFVHGPLHWILDANHNPVPVDDVIQWGMWFEKHENRRVGDDTVERPDSDPVRVSTVFLGIDHNFGDSGPPLLFESMVFGGPLDEHQCRYPTWDSALEGHKMLLDETVLEGKVAAWEVKKRIDEMAARARELQRAAYEAQMAAIEKAKKT